MSTALASSFQTPALPHHAIEGQQLHNRHFPAMNRLLRSAFSRLECPSGTSEISTESARSVLSAEAEEICKEISMASWYDKRQFKKIRANFTPDSDALTETVKDRFCELDLVLEVQLCDKNEGDEDTEKSTVKTGQTNATDDESDEADEPFKPMPIVKVWLTVDKDGTVGWDHCARDIDDYAGMSPSQWFNDSPETSDDEAHDEDSEAEEGPSVASAQQLARRRILPRRVRSGNRVV